MDGVIPSMRGSGSTAIRSAAKGLEHRLGLMVRILATQIIDMQSNHGVIYEALKNS